MAISPLISHHLTVNICLCILFTVMCVLHVGNIYNKFVVFVFIIMTISFSVNNIMNDESVCSRSYKL